MKYLIFTVAMLRTCVSLPLFIIAILLKGTGAMLERIADCVMDGPPENKIV